MNPHQLAVEWDASRDDWSGVASAAERRRIQNRLNQRLYRKKKHQERWAAAAAATISKNTTNDKEMTTTTSTAVQKYTTTTTIHNNNNNNNTSDRKVVLDFIITLSTGIRLPAHQYKRLLLSTPDMHLRGFPTLPGFPALDATSLTALAPSNTTDLARLNVISSLAANAALLAITLDDFERDDAVSPFLVYGPPSSNSAVKKKPLPSSLAPTRIQKETPHHPWIDLFPLPSLRDRAIVAAREGVVDEDALCLDMFGQYSGRASEVEDDDDDDNDDDDGSVAPVAVWGDPTDERSWELSPGFLRRWGEVLVRGCPEIVEATNAWRRRRGLRAVDVGGRVEEVE